MKFIAPIIALSAFALPFRLLAETVTLDPVIKHDATDNGSAGIAVGPDHFIGASDEKNVLRLYTSAVSAPLKDVINLDDELLSKHPELGFEKKDDPSKYKEIDMEGAALLTAPGATQEKVIFWIGSHGRSSNNPGVVAPNRRLLFATTLTGTGADAALTVKGRPCTTLLAALLAVPKLIELGLVAAETQAPEALNGLNIESLCPSLDGTKLLIGFRNPIPNGLALIVPLNNPFEVIDDQNPKPPQFGELIRPDLKGLGIRDMTVWHGRYLIVAGGYKDKDPVTHEPMAQLYHMDGAGNVELITSNLNGLNPEAALVHGPEAIGSLELLSDDGKKSFSSVRVIPQ